jgi:hypothetical protein
VHGSLAAGRHLVAPILGTAVTHSGNGYREVGADSGVVNDDDGDGAASARRPQAETRFVPGSRHTPVRPRIRGGEERRGG